MIFNSYQLNYKIANYQGLKDFYTKVVFISCVCLSSCCFA